MSEGLNRVMLLGNLGADPELRVTQGGQAILKLRLATTESYVDRENVRKERTEWHSITLWGKRGEALAKILGKGDRLFVEGRIETSSYEKDGEKRYRTEVVATNILLNGRADERRREEREEPPPRARRDARAAPSPRDRAPQRDFADDYAGGADDDIPF